MACSKQYSVTYEKIHTLVLYFRWMQEQELDVFSITSSFKGFGKSSTILQLCRKYIQLFGLTCQDCKHEFFYTGKAIVDGKNGFSSVDELHENCPKCGSSAVKRTSRFNIDRYLAWDNEDLKEKIYTELPKYSPIMVDEGVRLFMGEDWNKTESKQLKKLVAQMRTKGFIVLTNIPKFKWIEGKYRNDMTSFWIRVLKRGLNLVLEPDLGETDDPWHLKEFEYLLGSYSYRTSTQELIDKAEKLKRRHPCVIDYFFVPKVPDEIYAEYQKSRDKKAFAREVDVVDEKEMGKIVVYNMLNNYDLFFEAIEKTRDKKPTVKLLSESLFFNPNTGESIITFSTVANWNREMSKKVKVV